MITPTNTAKAKLCRNTVINETNTITTTSCVGICPKVLKLAHSNVPMATITITPVNAAIGNCSIIGAPYIMNISNNSDATIPDNRCLAPEDILINDCPIIAHPPIPENKPVTKFAVP